MRREDKISYTADNIVIRGNGDDMELLVVQRKFPPYQGRWALPGGFIEKDEMPLTASLRELEEETHLVLTEDEAIPLSIRKKENRDPRGPVITHPFLFWIGDTPVSVKAGDDAKQVQWMKITELGSLAFDHGAILCEALGRFWKEVPMFDARLKAATLPSLFYKKKVTSTIYFGGSFNPWHEGHDQCLKECQDSVGENYDLVVVPDVNPWKADIADENDLFGENCFFQKFLDIANHLKDTPFSVFPGFWGSEIPNPTISWFPGTKDEKRGLLIGDDNFLKFQDWKDYKFLLHNMECIYTVPRLFSIDELKKQKVRLSNVNPDLKVVILREHEYQDVSSTKLRSKT